MPESYHRGAFIAALLLAVLLLAACGGGAAEEVSATTTLPEPEVQVQPAEEQPATEAPTQAPTLAPTEGEAEEPAAEGEGGYELGFALGDPNLRATDPASVNMASGQITLLEFFAFWWPLCQQMAPVVHGLENKYGAEMNFVFLDIDDPNTEQFQSQYNYDRRFRPFVALIGPDGQVLVDEDGNQSIFIGIQSGEHLEMAIIDALTR